ncbi:ABC transporter ATP-binding protein [candidate division WOR-3 bacterium]|nr:ABC transporter ATP-binding protein [candidate division WOR-3 bacterium]
MWAIELKEIEVGYNKFPIIKRMSLKIESGDFLGIIGPNGTGKTTLLRVMAGIIPQWKGEVLIQEKKLLSYKRKDLAKLQGVVPQQSFFSLPFTCFDVVLMGRFPYVRWIEKEIDYETAIHAMKLTDTYKLKDRSIHEVSGGELQRVRIARALAQSPKILLLDEPTAHLDIHHEIGIFEILKKLNNEGLTVIIASHNLNTIGAYAKKLLLLNNGELIKLGPPDEVLKKELIEEVYKSSVLVKENPITHTPLIIPIVK